MTDRSRNSKENRIQISKQDLTSLLKDVKQEILKETVNKNEDFMSIYTQKHQFDDKLAFSRLEIKEMLKDYKAQIKTEISADKKTRVFSENAYYQNLQNISQQYSNFQNLLWYYYMYNPELYRQLIDEYNHRLHNQLLGSLGLTEEFSKGKNLLPTESGVKFNVSETNGDAAHGKGNLRKSVFPAPELNTSQNARKSLFLGEGLRKTTGRKMEENEGNQEENLKRVRKKSVMPSREQRENLEKKDREGEAEEKNENFKKKSTKYRPVLPLDLLQEKKSMVLRKSLFPNKKMPSVHTIITNVSSNNSSDFDIYGNNERKSSIKKGMSPFLRRTLEKNEKNEKNEQNEKNEKNAKNEKNGKNEKFENNANFAKFSKKSNIEEREIIVERYGLLISRIEYEALKHGDTMSENLMNFLLSYLQEKQRFLPQKKLEENKLRILFFPMKNLRNPRKSIEENEFLKDKTMENYDKIVFSLKKDEIFDYFSFAVAETDRKILKFYDIYEENEEDHDVDLLMNFKRFFMRNFGKKNDWKFEKGNIEKIYDKRAGALYLCKSIYLLSQGVVDLNNKEKKTYEFKQKFLNVLLKMPKIIDFQGDIQDFNVFDL